MKKSIFLILGLFFTLSLFAAKAKSTKSSADPEVILEEAQQAFFAYDFEKASEKYDEYRHLQEKKKKPLAEDLDNWERQLSVATNAFDRVEKIEIVDSISLPRDSFFKNYRLPASSGMITIGSNLPDNPGFNKEDMVFSNEDKDYMIWSSANEDGYLILNEGYRLLDGEWVTQRVEVGEEEDGDFLYPFMSSDGQTLYYANDGEDSMGGLDIFVAQRDPVTGVYRQPLNMGMPFNSPYDDFMLAIDEENGIGWWATDRNSEDGNVTVYIYVVNDIRKNYPSETDDLVSLAKIEDYKKTQDLERENFYKDILQNLPQNNSDQTTDKIDFILPMPKGKIYHRLKDFKNKKAADQMVLYLKKYSELERAETLLKDARIRLRGQDQSQIKNITELENKVESLKKEVDTYKNAVYRIEKSTR